MKELIRYDLWKQYKSNRFMIATMLIIQVLLIPLVFVLDRYGAYNTEIVFAFLFISLIIALPFVLFADNLSRFNRDISGKQSPLELSIPQPSWALVLSKLIGSVCSFLILSFVSAVSLIIFTFVMQNAHNPNTKFVIKFDEIFKTLWNNGGQLAIMAVSSLFRILFFMIIVYFCIALAKSISHKNKIATPIGIIAFVGLVIIMLFADRFSNYFPIVKYNLMGQSDNLFFQLFGITLSVLAFFGTSWLMEKKLES